MNTDNGALEFDSYFNNEKLFKTVDEATKKVKDYTTAVTSEGEKMEDSFKITAENIRIQKDVILQLEKNLNNLNIEISKLKPGTAQEQLKQEAKQVAAELKGEKDALKMLEGELQQTEMKTKTFRSQIREAREELIRMEQAGLRGTEAYNILQKKLGELTDALGDATAQANVLANDERGFQGVVSMVGGITGAFSAAQGAVGLFAGENENLNKIMLKVQSLMAITIGLQQVAEMLNKDSYFSIVILTKAKELLAVAEMKVATAFGVSTAAARVLMATLTLGLSVAITAIIVGLSKLASKSAEAKKSQQEFNKAVADNAAESIIAIKQMQTEWNALGDNLKAKEKYVQDNAKKFDELGVSVNGVNDAEKLLKGGTNDFIAAMMLRAKAMAATELATEKYKEALAKNLDKEAPAKYRGTQGVMRNQTLDEGSMIQFFGRNKTPESLLKEGKIEINPAWEKYNQKMTKAFAESNRLFEMAATFTMKEREILKSLNISGDEIVKGSIQALEDSIARLEEKYKKAANSKERNNLLKEIKSQQALLDKIDGLKPDKKPSTEDPLKKELERKKNLYSQYYKWINSNDPILQQAAGKEFESLLKNGSSFIDYLQKRRAELMGVASQTPLQRNELTAVNNAIADETNKTVLKDFEDALKSQIEKAGSVLDVLKLIKTESDKLKNDNSELDNAKKQVLEDAQRAADERSRQESEKQKEEYNQLVAEFANFERRKQAIVEQYDKKRKTAGTDADVVSGLDKEQAEKIKALQEEFIKAAGLFDLFAGEGSDFLTAKIKAVMPLFSELADATKTELAQVKKIIEGIEVTPDQKALLISLGLTEKQVDELIEKLKKLKEQGAEAVDEQKWKKVLDTVGQIANSVGDLGGVLSGFGGTIGEIGRGLQGLAGSFNDVYTAMTSTNKGDVISSGINGLVGLFSIVFNQIKANKEAQEEWNMKIAESAHLMQMTKLEAMGFKQSNLFGVENPYSEAIAGMNQYAEAMKMLNDNAGMLGAGQVQTGTKKVTDAGNVMGGVGAGAAAGAAIGTAIGGWAFGLGTVIGAGVGAIVGGITGAAAKKTVPVFESLKSQYGEIYNKDTFELNPKILADYDKLDDATKQMVDNWQEIKEKAIEAQKQIDDTIKQLAGDMGNTLSDQLKEAFRDGDVYAAVDDYKAYVSGAIEEIISKLIFNQVFGQMFEKLSAEMKASFDVGGDQSIVDDMVKFNDTYKSGLDLYNKMMKEAQDTMKAQGIDILGKASDTSLKGAISGASEETTSLLAGYANAIRLNQNEALIVMREHLIALNRIVQNTSYNSNLLKLDDMLAVLKSLASNGLRSQGL